jgi:hypothetical protein
MINQAGWVEDRPQGQGARPAWTMASEPNPSGGVARATCVNAKAPGCHRPAPGRKLYARLILAMVLSSQYPRP